VCYLPFFELPLGIEEVDGEGLDLLPVLHGLAKQRTAVCFSTDERLNVVFLQCLRLLAFRPHAVLLLRVGSRVDSEPVLLALEPAACVLAVVLILVHAITVLAVFLEETRVLATIRPRVHAVPAHHVGSPLTHEGLPVSPLVVSEA